MKINKKYLVIIGFFTVLLIACNSKNLDTVPQDAIIDANAFSTATRVEAQLLSLYSALKNGRLYGGRVVIYGDIKADQFINQTSNSVTGYDVWTATATNSSTSVEYLWSQAYATINKCNIFLYGIDSLGGADVVGDALAVNYKAEAKLIRALCYTKLLEYFSLPYAYGTGGGSNLGVPLRLKAITSGGSSNLARSSVAEVYTQILSDLNDAEDGLPTSYSSDYDNTTRAHVNTAIALKTRVFLNMQDYDSVVTEANKIVSTSAPFSASTGVANTLQDDITTVFTTPYTSPESILSMPMTSTSGDYPGTQNGLAYYFSTTVGNSEYSLNSSGIIADSSWLSTDDRRGFIYTKGTTTKTYWLSKYSVASPYTDYVPVIRYAEVMLNLAEALARTTGTVDSRAVALLNAIRQRSDASTTFTTSSFSSSTDLITAILKERTIEFLGEGIRNGDLMRLVQTIPSKGSVAAVTAGSSNYIWPISAEELSLNSLAVDN